MTHRILPTLTLVALLTAHGFSDDALTDHDKLQGDWRVTSIRVKGQDIDISMLQDGGYIFTKNQLKITGPVEGVAEFTLRPDSKPKELDLKAIKGVGKGKTVYGLYRFDGEKLVLCIGDVRPSKFSGDDDAGLLVLERRKKND